ncbi:MAG TPA: biotin transporter BioY [Aggregatilineales bacterium]|nr:biotin transporter BioY [Aggregatilineales bacterium]
MQTQETGAISRRLPLPVWLARILRIALFSVLIAISARIAIPIPGTPVPITAQVLMILLAGMSLGPVEGAISVIAYVAAIAAGMPIDAYGLGAAALHGPTAGYLLAFPIGALIAGLPWRAPERTRLALMIVCGVIAALVIELVGMVGLLPIMKGDVALAMSKGVVPFLFVDMGKALLAASLVNLGYQSWLRWLNHPSVPPQA